MPKINFSRRGGLHGAHAHKCRAGAVRGLHRSPGHLAAGVCPRSWARGCAPPTVSVGPCLGFAIHPAWNQNGSSCPRVAGAAQRAARHAEDLHTALAKRPLVTSDPTKKAKQSLQLRRHPAWITTAAVRLFPRPLCALRSALRKEWAAAAHGQEFQKSRTICSLLIPAGSRHNT